MILDILSIGKSILDKIIPDKAQRQEYELKLLQLQQEGAFKSEEMRYQAITKEAESQDKWTSRARPSFLYVMYIVILAAFPMGIVFVYEPTLAAEFTTGFKAWLDAIPGDMWMLFGAGYLGYGAFRSYDKKINTK